MGKPAMYTRCLTQTGSIKTEVPTLNGKPLLERDHHMDRIFLRILRMMSFTKSHCVSIELTVEM